MTGVPVARILGIEIRLQVGWVLVAAILATLTAARVSEVDPAVNPVIQWLLGGGVAAGFLGSAIAHDLGHAIVARRRGVDVRSILISFFGGATPLDPAAPDAGDDLVIAISGPVVSLALGGGLAVAATAIAASGSIEALVAAQVLAVLAILNLVLGGVNLVPAYPLDGGRIVRDIAWRRGGGQQDGWRAAASTGRIVALLTIVVGLGVAMSGDVTNGAMIALSGWFLLLSARAIRERVKVDALIGDLTVEDVMERDNPTVHPELTVDTFAGQLLDGETPITAIAVVQGEQVIGLLGVRQVRRLRQRDWA
ncbi:MAG: site-2 protease family protein, partial [Candidatus Limnocylindrales bacterium]